VPVTSSGTGLTRPSVTLSKLPVGSGYGGSSAGRLMGHCQATREKGQGADGAGGLGFSSRPSKRVEMLFNFQIFFAQ
jgi:hypothetical protein